jgi:ribosome maturation factor RimP
MVIAHTRLSGLDKEKILSLVEPVLASHRVDGVELVWRGDRGGQVLELTLEKPGSKRSGEGITIDLCSKISRELSAVLDESGIISQKYSLEVGSPGIERALYLPSDYARFAGHEIKVRTKEPLEDEGFVGQKTVRGTLFGLEGEAHVVLETERGNLKLSLEAISSARLVFSWNQSGSKTGREQRPTSAAKQRSTKRSIQNGRR